jgi:CheY-like chemotaxis protein
MHAIVRHTFDETVELKIASDAEMALALAMEQPPDLVLLDINLPDMDGFEVLRHLRQSDRTKDIKVIALSTDAMEHQVEKGLDAGFAAYLTKPVNLVEVQTAIRYTWQIAEEAMTDDDAA